MQMGYWAKHPCTHMPFNYRVSPHPQNKVSCCYTSTKLTIPHHWRKHSQRAGNWVTCRGNWAFWCSDIFYCWLSQSGAAVASVPLEGTDPQKGGVNSELWSDVSHFLQKCQHLWNTEERILHTKQSGAQPELSPAAVQRLCTVAWVLSMYHREEKMAQVTLAEVL